MNNWKISATIKLDFGDIQREKEITMDYWADSPEKIAKEIRGMVREVQSLRDLGFVIESLITHQVGLKLPEKKLRELVIQILGLVSSKEREMENRFVSQVFAIPLGNNLHADRYNTDNEIVLTVWDNKGKTYDIRWPVSEYYLK